MAIFEFKLPDLGEGIVTSEIVELHVEVGQVVEEDDIIVAMMTDKATVELPSPVDGKIVSIAGNVGDIVNVGSTLISFEVGDDVSIETTAETAAPVAAEAPKAEPAKVDETTSKSDDTPAQPIAANTASASVGLNENVLASPSLRRRAMDLDIDLSLVVGTGPAGRISHEDLDGFIASGGAYISKVGAVGGGVAIKAAKANKPSVNEIPLRGVRRKIAEAMAYSKRNIPHYTYVEEVDVTDLEALRVQLNQMHGKDRGKLTILPFMIKALGKAVQQYPQCNAQFDQEAGIIKEFSELNMGMATNTDNGLMVPVIKSAQNLSLWELGTQIKELAEKARTGKASRDELTGSSITLTSLGKIAGIVTTPIINAPEVCIIGNNKIIERPMVVDGNIVIRKMMNISGSFDHRIVDGYDGAMMIQTIKQLLEVPATLFMGDE